MVTMAAAQKGISLMGREYKGHVFDILVKPVQDSNRWTFDAVIHIPQGARDRVTELKATRDFANQAEAETEALHLLKNGSMTARFSYKKAET